MKLLYVFLLMAGAMQGQQPSLLYAAHDDNWGQQCAGGYFPGNEFGPYLHGEKTPATRCWSDLDGKSVPADKMIQQKSPSEAEICLMDHKPAYCAMQAQTVHPVAKPSDRKIGDDLMEHCPTGKHLELVDGGNVGTPIVLCVADTKPEKKHCGTLPNGKKSCDIIAIYEEPIGTESHDLSQYAPLKCGPYQHVTHDFIERTCGDVPCNFVGPDYCTDTMHPLKEKEFQELREEIHLLIELGKIQSVRLRVLEVKSK